MSEERTWNPGDSPVLPPAPESAYPAGAVALPIDLSQAIVCYSKCTPCQFQECPGEPHTWMESEDLDHENRHPSTPEEWDALTAERPCGCHCMRPTA